MALSSLTPRRVLFAALSTVLLIYASIDVLQHSRPPLTALKLPASHPKVEGPSTTIHEQWQTFKVQHNLRSQLASLLPVPLSAVCDVTDLDPRHPLVHEYGETNIRLSRSYEGSGEKIQAFFKKATKGETLRVGVVGGSVSAGHGLKMPLSADNHVHSRIFDWLKVTFPEATFSLDMSAAMPAQTNIYFSYCVLEHLDVNLDFIIVELDINSFPISYESTAATESLFRTLLELPNAPAVIAISTFGLVFDNMISGWQNTVSVVHWLDVPFINIRNWLLPFLLSKPHLVKTFFENAAGEVDTRHVNYLGHRALADMTIAYLFEQLCRTQREMIRPRVEALKTVWPSSRDVTALPRLGMFARWHETSQWISVQPRCRSILSKVDPLVPTHNQGWLNTTYNDKVFWEAKEAGAEISFEIQTSRTAGLWFWRTSQADFGSVECNVDGDKSTNRIIHALDPFKTAPTFDWTGDLWFDLQAGRHLLSCKVMEGSASNFRISATITR